MSPPSHVQSDDAPAGTLPPAGRPGPGVTPGYAAFLALIAAITYSTFLLEHLLSPGHDIVNGYVSELSAADQPYHAVYNAGDYVTGALTISVAITALVSLRRRLWSVFGWAFLALFGLCAIGDASFPLDCAPSLDTLCALRERAGRVSLAHELHAVTSSLVITFGVAALLALSVAARRYGWWPALARWGWPLAVAEIVLAFATLVAMVLGEWLGVLERLQILVLVLGLTTIAWALDEDRRLAQRGTPP